jgi:PAS domain S-box-containing protein
MSTSAGHSTAPPPAEILTGGGAAGHLMRSRDWSRMPPGAPAAWPPSLRIVVGMMLASGQPMAVIWGRERTLLYNDAFCSVLGSNRHPAALGRDAREALAEDWHIIGPLVDRVTIPDGDGVVFDPPVRLSRVGYADERYFDVACSGVRDETGIVRGAFLTCTDMTNSVLTERRLAAQYAVSRILAEPVTLEEVVDAILLTIGQELGWDLSVYWAVDHTADRLLRRAGWCAPTIDASRFEAVSQSMRFSRGIGLPGRVWASGEAVWIPDVLEDSNFPRGPAAAVAGLHSAFAFPIYHQDEILGVVECFSRALRRPDADLLHAVSALGRQIGQFVGRRRAEDARTRLAAIVESSSDAIIGKSIDGIITSWNAGATRLYGYDRDEVLGRPVSILIPPGQPNELPVILERLQRAERIEPYETRRLHKDGRPIDVSINVSPIVGPRGELIGASTIARDISERKRIEVALRRSEERFRIALAPAPIVVWEQDAELRYQWLYDPSSRLNVGDALGKTDADLLPPELATPLTRLKRRVIRTSRGTRQEVKSLGPHDVATYDLTVEPVIAETGQVVGITCAAVDISPLKDLERQKDDFLASAAHDLRNPLTSVRGYAELLQRRINQAGAPESDPLFVGLTQILLAADRMSGLIDQMLDLARLQMGRPLELHREATDLVALVRGAVAERAEATELHAIRVMCELPRLIGHWDPARLERAVQNLLSNAIKYSPDGGEVTVALAQQVTPNGGAAILDVSDRGLGIPAEDLPRLFDRFHRARNVVGRVAGTGLGLASVRQVVEEHGGSVAVESRLGMGSRFTLRLPLET